MRGAPHPEQQPTSEELGQESGVQFAEPHGPRKEDDPIHPAPLAVTQYYTGALHADLGIGAHLPEGAFGLVDSPETMGRAGLLGLDRKGEEWAEGRVIDPNR
jgi:hypothetical protein